MPLSKAANEKMWDIILTDALEEHCRREVKDLVDNNQEVHVFSKEFERNIRKIRNSIGRKKAIKTAGKFAFKSFTVLACLMGISFGALLTQPTVSASVINIFTKTFSPVDDGYYININKNKNTKDDSIIKNELNYIPDGYSFFEASIADNNSLLVYKNTDNQAIIFEYTHRDVFELYIDNEHYISKTELINGQEYTIYSCFGEFNSTVIFWVDDSFAYMLSAQLSEEEMFKIIENIK